MKTRTSSAVHPIGSTPKPYRALRGHHYVTGHYRSQTRVPFPFGAPFQTATLRLCLEQPDWTRAIKPTFYDDPLEGSAFRIIKRITEQTGRPATLRSLADACIQELGKPAAGRVMRPLLKVLDEGDRAYLLNELLRFVRFQSIGESLIKASDLYQRQDVDGLIKVMQDAAKPLPGEAAPQQGHALVSIKKLLAEPDETVKWLVENRLPTGGLSMLAGKPKVGKGTLARCLAVAVARGQKWLGCQTLRGPVIYVAGVEDKRHEVRDHFRRLGASNERIYIRFHSAPSEPLTWLGEQIDRIRPVLVIIDALFRFIRLPEGAGKDYDAVTAALEPLLVLARQTAVHILTVHHMGKGERSDPFDAILGSTAILGTVDTALAYRRYEKYRTLQSRQRYGPDLDEITLPLDPKTGMVSEGPLRTEADAAQAGQHILDALAKAGRPVTEDDLETVIEGRTQVWKKALRRLCESGHIERTDRHGKPNAKGGKGNPFHYAIAAPAGRSQVPTTPSQPGNLKRETLKTSDRISKKDSGSQNSRGPGSQGPRFPTPRRLSVSKRWHRQYPRHQHRRQRRDGVSR